MDPYSSPNGYSRSTKLSRPIVGIGAFAAATLVFVLAGCGNPTVSATGTEVPPPAEGPQGSVAADGSGSLEGFDVGEAMRQFTTTTSAAPEVTTDSSSTTVAGNPLPTSIAASSPPTTRATTPAPVVTTPVPLTAPITAPPPMSTVPLKPAPSALSTAALSGDEQYLLGRINSLRSSRGLGALIPEQALETASRNHTNEMIGQGSLTGSSNLFVAVNASFASLIELIARGPNAQFVADRMVEESTYTAALTGPYAHVGVGAVTSGGNIWVTIVLGN